ncbi:MAG TPA: hypothetical protein PLB55_03275, partial [Prosthecobacter sp.]|nr:hypothetical protein [Prosthecobacter sp.]
LAAGVPQLIMHMAHDQPDNADRLERLGAGIGLSVRQFTADRVTLELTRLLGGAAASDAAAKCAKTLSESRDVGALMRWIEARVKPRLPTS